MFNITIHAGTKVWSSVRGQYGFLYPSDSYYITQEVMAVKPKYFTGGNGKTAFQAESGVIVWVEASDET